MKKSVVALGFLLLSLPLVAVIAAEQAFEEELHYFEVIPPQPGAEGDRVQVLEFFWYACPHCYTLEPHLNGWLEKKPDNIEFDRVPAMFPREDVVLHAKTYYALRLMGVEDELHEKIFRVIHDEDRQLKTQKDMEAFLDEQKIDLEAYRKAMQSFAVQTQARRAAVLAQRFDVSGVPAIVVDGKYRTTGLGGSTTMEVTDYLIQRVEEEKKKGAEAATR
jgi:thiol:disulfide interchange protein DsbA